MNKQAAFGCKRVVRDQGYLAALNRPNVELTFERIGHVESDGIVTEAGTYLFYSRFGRCNNYLSHLGEKVPADVIVYGTGFVTVGSMLLG